MDKQMKLSYTTFSVQDKTLEQSISLAKEAGLGGIELRGRDNCHISPLSSFQYVEAAGRAIREAGLVIPCLTAYTRLFCSSVKELNRQTEELEPMIALAEYLKAASVRIFMGEVPTGMNREEAEEQARMGLMHISRRLESSSVKVIIETHDSVQDGKSLARLLRDVPPSIGVLLDIIHPWKAGEEIGETLRLIGDRICHVHIKDAVRITPEGPVYCGIGEGLLPVRQDVQTLAANGYDGFFSLEWEPSPKGSDGISFEAQLYSFKKFMMRMEASLHDETAV